MSVKHFKAVCVHIVYILIWCRPAVSFSKITHLPGFTASLPFNLKTGYIGVGDVEYFYYFIESENNPSQDPLMLWLTGGPGCSALSALFFEIGPLQFNMVEYNGSLPTFALNPYSWTKWLQIHPEFITNPLYVAGDSYAGKIVPIMAQAISDGIENEDVPAINLRGYLAGNPKTDSKYEENSKIPYYNRMALISDELYESAKRNCKEEYVEVIENIKCVKNLQAISECIAYVNMPHILEPNCPSDFTPKSSVNKRKYLPETHEYDLRLRVPAEFPKFGCRNYHSYLCKIWAGDDSVQQALHIRKGTIEEWIRCNASLDYDMDVESAVGYHLSLSTKGYSALIYSGDHDRGVTYVGTESWIKSLNLSIIDNWRPWFVDGEVAGYSTEYENNFTFATVKGAGHTAPEYNPKECFAMLSRWISQQPL